ncbi:MAG: helix-turn-helix domain-containing protein [Clostridia bacterium]|nr:helix-turn-helix domain-containing protein [Clostridia bacterium]
MAKGKYQYWMSEDGLTLLAAWARDGLTDEQIAQKCGISRSTLSEWKNKYPDISDALRRGKEIVDVEVENALYRKCLGYNVPITKHFKLKEIQYDEDTGKKISEVEKLVEVEEQVHIPADTTAQKFWLSNRCPDKWRDKPEFPAAARPDIVTDPLSAALEDDD